MGKTKKSQNIDETEELNNNEGVETAQSTNSGTENQPQDELSETDTLSAEVASLTEKVEQLTKDKLLLMADFDNYRKRTIKEKADLIKSGGEECLKNLLPIIDDFERSLQAINTATDIEALVEGVNLIYNKFKGYLAQNGVKEIETTDAPFDTEYHEAVTTFPVEDPEKKGKVIDCVQKGYTMNDKVIRFSKVVVGE
ncbi:MAG: nucleotide exchange factor GrpE [Bacteroidales bacterium]|nr:nucleotide exchange factor GrpE [Bacteroidales bacterium]MBR5532135.1 nucleotide exchange factor GrpE [Bacteroidales bacterium]